MTSTEPIRTAGELTRAQFERLVSADPSVRRLLEVASAPGGCEVQHVCRVLRVSKAWVSRRIAHLGAILLADGLAECVRQAVAEGLIDPRN